MKNKQCGLTDLFVVFLKIGAFAFGGGYGMLTLIEREVVDKKQWVSPADIVDIFAVTICLPGAVGLNAAAFIGYTVRGITGAVVAVCANLLPAAAIVLILSHLLFSVKGNFLIEAAFLGIRPAVIGLIICAAYRMAHNSLDGGAAKALCALAALVCITVSDAIIPVILAGGIIGYGLQAITRAKSATDKEK